MTAGTTTADLGTVADLIMGQAPPSKECNVAGNGIPFVKVGEFGEHRPVIREWTTNPLRMARRTDVLLCVVGATCGKINLGEECAIGRSVAAIRPHPDKVGQSFLYYFMMTLVERLRSGSVGAAQTVISKDMIESVKIPVPPLDEQKRIVEILDQAFEAIAVAKANTEKNLANAREIFNAELKQIFDGPPTSWRKSSLGTDVEFIDYRGKTPTKTNSGIKLVTAKNVRMGYVKEDPKEYIAVEDYESWMTRGIPQYGDILFTTEAPLANVAQLTTNEKVVFAQRIIVMHPDSNILDSAFLKYALMSPPLQQALHDKGTGATATGIKASLLKKIPIQYPKNTKEQKFIAERLDRMAGESKELAQAYQRKLSALDDLKQSLLHAAFSGELTTRKAIAA